MAQKLYIDDIYMGECSSYRQYRQNSVIKGWLFKMVDGKCHMVEFRHIGKFTSAGELRLSLC